jgi:hypothetical protein
MGLESWSNPVDHHGHTLPQRRRLAPVEGVLLP